MSPLSMASIAKAPNLLGSMSSSTSCRSTAGPASVPADLLALSYFDFSCRIISSASSSPVSAASEFFTRFSTAVATCSFRRSARASALECELLSDLALCRLREALRLRLRLRLLLRLRLRLPRLGERRVTAFFAALHPPPVGPRSDSVSGFWYGSSCSVRRRGGEDRGFASSFLESACRLFSRFRQSFFAQAGPTRRCSGMELALADCGTGRLDSSPRRKGLYSFSLTFTLSGSSFSLASFSRSFPMEPKKSTSALATSSSPVDWTWLTFGFAVTESFGLAFSSSSDSCALDEASETSSFSFFLSFFAFFLFFCSFRFSFFFSFLLKALSPLSAFSSSFLPNFSPANITKANQRKPSMPFPHCNRVERGM
mmetsp:Transcript_76360/g.168689  ORF Transcript_76360/g.168689 Transcript_76360/m.168689 type:complete len:370 (-) Transcript_76360:6-1115(-)